MARDEIEREISNEWARGGFFWNLRDGDCPDAQRTRCLRLVGFEPRGRERSTIWAESHSGAARTMPTPQAKSGHTNQG